MKLKTEKISFKNILLIGFTILIFSILFGQGCGKYNAQRAPAATNTELSSGGIESIEVFPNTKTVSMSYSRQIVDSMVSCTGIKQATTSINTVYANRKGSLSQFGDALEVSAPMLMASVSIAGEVCNKLIADEMPLSSDQRRIFKNINFGNSPRSLASADVSDVVRRIARSCWSRDESADELDIMQSSLNDSFSSSDTTQSAMLMLCTGMLSSLSGVEN